MSLGLGIILDVITVVILILSAVLGAKKGLTITLVSFVSWFCCVILGFFFIGTVRDYLCANTSLDDNINNAILNSMGDSIADSSAYKAIPDLFSSWIDNSTSDIIYATSASLTNVIMSVISFLTIVIVIKLISFILIHLFSKKDRDGVIGFFDGFMGFLFGVTRAVIIVFIFFALLVPLLGLALPSVSEKIIAAMDTSYIAKYLYNDNALLIILRDFFA